MEFIKWPKKWEKNNKSIYYLQLQNLFSFLCRLARAYWLAKLIAIVFQPIIELYYKQFNDHIRHTAWQYPICYKF